MHIDLNAFFATCEELRDPKLKGLPLIIGSKGRSGIVSTANYAARKYGIHSGQPTFQAEKLCPSVLVLPPDFDYYRVMSHSFFSYVKRYSSIIEQASIDEAYVDMTGALKGVQDPERYFKELQAGLLQETGLPCSIGVAPIKWLAKMASDLKKPMGLVILRRRDIPKTLFPLPIESFWGIGKKTSPILRNLGVNTIGDLAHRLEPADPLIERELGKFAADALSLCRGKGSDHVDVEPWDPKSVGVSETLMRDIYSFDDAEAPLQAICQEVSERAKEERKVGYTISLTVKDNQFRLHQKSRTLDAPTSSFATIYEVASSLFKAHFSPSPFPIRLIGVTLGRLGDQGKQTVQMNLWNYESYEAMDETKLLINELNRKLDKPVFMRSSEAKKEK